MVFLKEKNNFGFLLSLQYITIIKIKCRKLLSTFVFLLDTNLNNEIIELLETEMYEWVHLFIVEKIKLFVMRLLNCHKVM